MNIINTREKFTDYILRRLGFPNVQINVTKEQLDDRIDDALSFYITWNMDLVQETIEIHKVQEFDPNTLEGEERENYIKENGLPMVKRFVELSPRVMGIIELRPIVNPNLEKDLDQDGNPDYGSMLFDFDFHLANATIEELTRGTNYGFGGGGGALMGSGLVNYDMTMRHLDLIKYELRRDIFFAYSRFNNKLVFNTKPSTKYVLIRCYKVIDLKEAQNLWNDAWFKDYVKALVKIQWGENLRKFKGVAVLGGAQIDADGIMQEGLDDKNRLEEELKEGTVNAFPVVMY